MKKRRIVIISFVLAAVLAIGVGFAAMADTLTITGPVNFVKADEVLGAKDDAIKFVEVVSTDPVKDADGPVSISAAVSDTDKDAASISVTINDITGRVEPYVATAIFSVTYEDTNPTLDPVYLFPQATISNNPAGFEITAVPVEENGDAIVGADANKLKRGQTMLIKVTVTYTPQTTTVTVGETISVRLVYEDQNVNPNP